MFRRMNQETAIEMLRSLITVSLTVMTPVILAALVVGVAVSLLQAITSIQEPTLSFAPKLIAIGAVIIIGAPWMVRQLMQFTIFFINKIPEMTR
jgi:flagellar biosynthetic protein FliQ